MIRLELKRVFPNDLIDKAQIAAASAAKGERQNLVNFLDNLDPEDLELLTSPLQTRFNADSFGINQNAWDIAKELTPMAILRGIAEEDKDKAKF